MVTARNDRFWSCTHNHLHEWDMVERTLLKKIQHYEANFIYLLLSRDAKTIYSSAYGPYIFVHKTDVDYEEEKKK